MTDGELEILGEVRALRGEIKDVAARVAVLERKSDLRTALISLVVALGPTIIGAVAGCSYSV